MEAKKGKVGRGRVRKGERRGKGKIIYMHIYIYVYIYILKACQMISNTWNSFLLNFTFIDQEVSGYAEVKLGVTLLRL